MRARLSWPVPRAASASRAKPRLPSYSDLQELLLNWEALITHFSCYVAAIAVAGTFSLAASQWPARVRREI